ncbi:MAG: 4Fe-4S dicluster domain-containing protein [Candidatus Hydrogenedentota bacterium]|nr:MAG: 4Fe-4S dicluster domain-containing protein [Candidatus Hydrogenedentota bacterium]
MRRFPGISKTIMKSLVGKPSTLMYPQRKRTYQAATRGHVEIEIEKCIFCGLCEKNCPTKALLASKEKNEWDIDSLKCCQCRRCVEVCPKKCLSMENVYFPVVRTREDGKYLTVLPPGVVPAYQKKAKKKAKAGKPEEVKFEEPGAPEASAAESSAERVEKEEEEG